MRNNFVPFAFTQVSLLAWTHFNWNSGGLSEMQAITIANVVVFATLAGAWRAFPHITWVPALVAWIAFCQSASLIAWIGIGIIDWQTMVPLFVASQVLMILCTRSKAPVTEITPTANPQPPTVTDTPTAEKTTGG